MGRELRWVATLLAVGIALSSSPGSSLQRTVARLDESRGGDWQGSTSSCAIAYYNTCTGYVWVWRDWEKNARIGTVFTSCCEEDHFLQSSAFQFRWHVPAGWGFTSYVDVHSVDQSDCPTGAPIARVSVLPGGYPGHYWRHFDWGVPVPDRFAIVFTLRDDYGFGSPVAVASDGVRACGVCYPTSRETDSYLWGTSDSVLCPGVALNDGACNVEWIHSAGLSCDPLAVEDESWGSIKALYR